MRTKLFCAALLGMCAVAAPVHANGIYGKVGILGAGIGYSYDVSPAFTLRGDVTTIGTFKRDGNAGSFDYKAKFRNNQAMLYVDYFPFDSGFRLTAGLGARDMRVTGDANPNSAGVVEIGDVPVTFGPGDSAVAKVKMPAFAPYIGIGWSSKPSNPARGGWGFMADLGVTFGKPKTSFEVSDSVRAKLGADAQAAIDRQLAEIDDKAKKLKFFPSLYVGVSYTF